MAKSDAIFNLGLLVIVGVFGYLFAIRTGLFTPAVSKERGGTAACPKGQRYEKGGVFGFLEGCEAGYHSNLWGDSCMCDNPTTIKDVNRTSENVQPIPPPILQPSALSCEQAGYPPPCVRPDSGTTAATPYLEQPGMPFDPCINNPLAWECITR